jgi:DNA adenine methylase
VNGHADVAASIDSVMDSWVKRGIRTRRNWWDVLAGSPQGRERRVAGKVFPVLAAAQLRQRRRVTKNALTRRKVHIEKPRSAARIAHDPEPVVPEARPFLKWAGGKRQLLHEILPRLPKEFGTFHEPFAGGGALFFALRPRTAVLSDRNERLIRAYQGIKHNVKDVIEILKTYRNNKRFFLEMRRRPIDKESDAHVAAWLIFLNKTGFNGLYRVNSRNLFNVPYGANKKARLCDEENLRACALALAGADLRCENFDAVLDRAKPRDVVYFDPPYVPLSVTSYFTAYTSHGFGMEEQVRLRDVALKLRKRNVFVLLSNSSAPAVSDLYSKFTCDPVSASRMVNSDPKGRGRVTEFLIT